MVHTMRRYPLSYFNWALELSSWLPCWKLHFWHTFKENYSLRDSYSFYSMYAFTFTKLKQCLCWFTFACGSLDTFRNVHATQVNTGKIELNKFCKVWNLKLLISPVFQENIFSLMTWVVTAFLHRSGDVKLSIFRF